MVTDRSDEYHLFQIGGLFFLFDVGNVDLYLLSPRAYDLACHGVTDSSEVENLTYSTWKALRELARIRGQSQQSPADRTFQVIKKLETGPIDVRGLWLGIAHHCNLACTYCFADDPNFLGARSLMSPETAGKAIDFMISLTPDREDYDIAFFGGEPLLNKETIRSVFDHCGKLEKMGKRFSYSITTNGVLLSKDIYTLLVDHDADIMVSVDSCKETHDRQRPFKNGEPSWDVILGNLDKLPDWPDRITARSTIADSSVTLTDAFDGLNRVGFKWISLERVFPDSKNWEALSIDGLQAFKDDYFNLAERILGMVDSTEMIPLQGLRRKTSQLHEGSRKYYGCGTGVTHLYVTPEGDIVPCSRLLSDKSAFRMGDIYSGLKESTYSKFRANHVFNKPCSTCWARYVCGGQCYSDIYSVTGVIDRPLPGFCELEKHRIETAAYVLGRLGMPAAHQRPKSVLGKLLKPLWPFGLENTAKRRSYKGGAS
jgi:uncharacterized protein